MAYDQAASDWQREADGYREALLRVRAELIGVDPPRTDNIERARTLIDMALNPAGGSSGRA